MPRLVFALAALLCIPAASAYYDPFICLCNLQRSYAGVPPLGFSAELQGIAWRQASDMASMNEVTHSGADGSSPFTRLGNLGMASAGENVAGGQSSPSDAMMSFMNSPGHRANILNGGYTCFGGAQVGNKYAQEFGSGYDCPVPDCNGYYRRNRRAAPELPDAFAAIFSQAEKSNATAKTADGYRPPNLHA